MAKTVVPNKPISGTPDAWDPPFGDAPPPTPEVASLREAETAARRLRHLNEIGLALSAERNIHRLLELILTKSQDLTNADGGSLYIVQKPAASGCREGALYFRAALNDSMILNTSMSFPVDRTSLAGYSALTGQKLVFDDVYDLEPDAPYKFNRSFDQQHKYRTKSILVMPMKNHANAVIGVLQLINRKRHREVLLSDEAAVEREVLPFDQELAEVAASLASQAAVALENNLLLREIENLFDSFVRAAAQAIEDRDPCTSGHSQRVTILTVALAEAVSECDQGRFADTDFSAQQIKELRYAGMMHDFGKIGVRESVLTKSHKLHPFHFQTIKDRLRLLRASVAQQSAEEQIALLLNSGREAGAPQIEALRAETQERLARLDGDLARLDHANDPLVTYLRDEEYEQQQELLAELASLTYPDEQGVSQPLLTEDEVLSLSIRKGSLTADELKQVQEHAAMSYDFLRKIPWTQELQDIPNIAHCHHEKLNGTGYPRGVLGDDIPLQARMMTIADIYDALTAADRPYKKAMSAEQALRILQDEADRKCLDQDLLDIFKEQEIYKLTEGWHLSPSSAGGD